MPTRSPPRKPAIIGASPWTAFPQQPTETGQYIIAHSGGVAKISTYMANDKQWHGHSKLGWFHHDPREFGATHWMKYEGPPRTDEPRSVFKQLNIGDIIRFTHDRVYVGKRNPVRVVTKWKWTLKGREAVDAYWRHDKKDIPIKAGQLATVEECSDIKGKHRGFYYKVNVDGWTITLNEKSGMEFEPVNETKFHIGGAAELDE